MVNKCKDLTSLPVQKSKCRLNTAEMLTQSEGTQDFKNLTDALFKRNSLQYIHIPVSRTHCHVKIQSDESDIINKEFNLKLLFLFKQKKLFLTVKTENAK